MEINMEFKPFKLDHMKYMNIREYDKKIIDSFGKSYEQVLKEMTFQGPSFSLFKDGQILASGGVILYWNGVAEGWLITDEKADMFPKTFYKGIKMKLEELAEKLGLHRIHMNVIEGHDKSCRWLMRMGYRFEGLMKNYGPDKSNYIRFARVF